MRKVVSSAIAITSSLLAAVTFFAPIPAVAMRLGPERRRRRR